MSSLASLRARGETITRPLPFDEPFCDSTVVCGWDDVAVLVEVDVGTVAATSAVCPGDVVAFVAVGWAEPSELALATAVAISASVSATKAIAFPTPAVSPAFTRIVAM